MQSASDIPVPFVAPDNESSANELISSLFSPQAASFGSNGDDRRIVIVTDLENLGNNHGGVDPNYVSSNIVPMESEELEIAKTEFEVLSHQWTMIKKMIEEYPFACKVAIGATAKLIEDINKGLNIRRYYEKDAIFNIITDLLASGKKDRHHSVFRMVIRRWSEFQPIIISGIPHEDVKQCVELMEKGDPVTCSAYISTHIVLALNKSPFYPRDFQVKILEAKMKQKCTLYNQEYIRLLAEYCDLVEHADNISSGNLPRGNIPYIFNQMVLADSTASIYLFDFIAKCQPGSVDTSAAIAFFPDL